jgi:Spy/CpxP family protein refolding chaperone
MAAGLLFVIGASAAPSDAAGPAGCAPADAPPWPPGPPGPPGGARAPRMMPMPPVAEGLGEPDTVGVAGGGAFLAGIDLTEDQQDKLFAIVHAAMPALRDHAKSERKAREALQELAHSSAFSEATAASLAQKQAKAAAELSLLRIRMEHEIFSMLTPEQRARLVAHPRERMPPPDGASPWRP